MVNTCFDNTVTTEVQSSILINKYNIDVNCASLVWATIADYDYEYKTLMDKKVVLPEDIEGYAFTVEDLIKLLPENIKGCRLFITKRDSEFVVQYAYMQDKGDFIYKETHNEYLIYAVYSMLINILENE